MPKDSCEVLVALVFGYGFVDSVISLDAFVRPDFQHDIVVEGLVAEDDFVPAAVFHLVVGVVFCDQRCKLRLSWEGSAVVV